MDIVLLDATENEKDWLIVPVGAAREPFAALSRADVLVLTKTNLASPEDLQRIYQRVDRFLVKDRRTLICESQHVLTGFRNLETHQSVEKIAEGPVVLVSGIAKPRQFEALLAAAGVGPVLYHHQLGDHEGLNPGSLRTLEKKCSELGCRRLVLTEKDAVKWKTSGFEVWAAGLELQVTKNERELWNALARHFV